MTQPNYLTPEGEAKLKAELQELKGPRREELSKRLRSAIQMGDLSENADYHKAKEDQAFLEGRIQELEYILKNAIIVQVSDAPKDCVAVGVRVTVQEEGMEPEVFLIVGAKEADPKNGRISNESPIGSALLDHQVGDRVDVDTPGGNIHFTILAIE
jgi:transcription elongation factor GreA